MLLPRWLAQSKVHKAHKACKAAKSRTITAIRQTANNASAVPLKANSASAVLLKANSASAVRVTAMAVTAVAAVRTTQGQRAHRNRLITHNLQKIRKMSAHSGH